MARKRIALSVPPKMDDILERLSDLTNQPKSKLIVEMLEEYAPILEQTLNALEQIKANKERIAKGLEPVTKAYKQRKEAEKHQDQ